MAWCGGTRGGRFETVHTFCGNGDCSRGSVPLTGMKADRAGHLFGTTYSGGPGDEGVVYEITR